MTLRSRFVRRTDLRNNPRFGQVSSQLGKTLGGRDQGEDKIGGVPGPMNRSQAQGYEWNLEQGFGQ